MIDPEKSLEIWKTRSSPDARRKFEELITAEKIQIVPIGKAPDVIIGGTWPNATPGAQRFTCDRCGAYVALMPNGRTMRETYPSAALVCFPCLERE